MNRLILKFIILLIIIFGIVVFAKTDVTEIGNRYFYLCDILLVSMAIFTYFLPARLLYKESNESNSKSIKIFRLLLGISIAIFLLCILSILFVFTINTDPITELLWCLVFLPAGAVSLFIMLISWISHVLIKRGYSIGFIILRFILFLVLIYLLIIIKYLVIK